MFSHASIKVAEILKQLLEREGKREYLLGLVDRKRTCHGDLLFCPWRHRRGNTLQLNERSAETVREHQLN
jgi:hypothetical protein